jgi:hypothetical protein
VAVGALFVIPVIYFLLKAGAANLQVVLTILFMVLVVMLMIEGVKRRRGRTRQDDRPADHLHLQHPVLDVLRTGRQLVHFPGREHRQPRQRPRHGRIPDRLVPERELGGHHHLRADHRVDLGRHGPQERIRRSRANSAWASSSTAWPSAC